MAVDAIRRAIRLYDELRPGDEFKMQMRNVAIASLAITDVRLRDELSFTGRVREIPGWGVDSLTTQFACQLPNGDISVRKISDNSELIQLNRKALKRLASLEGEQPSFVFSRDRRWLASQSRIGPESTRLDVWDLKTGQRKGASWTVRGRIDHRNVDFSPDGKLMACPTATDRIRLVDTDTLETTTEFLGVSWNRQLQFSPDGTKVAFLDDDSAVIIRSIPDGKELLKKKVPGGVFSMSWHPDSRHFITGGHNDDRVSIWDSQNSNTPVTSWDGVNHSIIDITFGPKGELLCLTTWGMTTQIWHSAGVRIVELPRHNNATFSSDHRWIAFQAANRSLKRYEVARSDVCRMFVASTGEELDHVNDVAFSRDGKLLAAAHESTGVTIWDLESGRRIRRLPKHQFSMAFGPDDKTLFAGGRGTVDRWMIDRNEDEPPRLSEQKNIRALPGAAHQLTLSGDGSKMSLRLTYGNGVLIDSMSLDEIRKLNKAEDWMAAPVVSPDGRWFASGPRLTLTGKIWDAVSGELVADIQCETGSRGFYKFSTDSRWLIYSTLQEFLFYRTDTWKLEKRLRRRDFGFGNMAFSPDMRLLAVTEHKSVSLYEVISWKSWRN